MTIDTRIRMHSAEHILNATMVRLFGCNRSFSAHLNKKKSKCDYHFERPLTDQEIVAIEEQVNQVIQQDIPLTESFIGLDEAESRFNLERLPLEVKDQVRIISIGEVDAIPCIGQHVNRTGEIGSFKISTWDFEEGVLRIRYKLGIGI